MPRTLIEVDRSSDEPLYQQVRRVLEHGIAVGTFDPLHRLPSSRELSEQLGVSRNTINLAYQELMAEGYVDSQERRGLFVNPEMRRECRAQMRDTTPRIDWSQRMRRSPDTAVPHVEKRSGPRRRRGRRGNEHDRKSVS